MTYVAGALVRARGREWVVFPESSDDLLMLRPLGGADDEVPGIYLPVEAVEPARFPPPDTTRIGDDRSCRLLRDAVRLGFRSWSSWTKYACVAAADGRTARHQRHELMRALAASPQRHVILVTATPHSGKDEDFR